MCDSLLNVHKFGIDAIAAILSTAEKYGQPINVIKSLDTYGSIKLMLNKQYEAEGKVQETDKLLHQLEGQSQTALKHFESLSAIAMKTGAEVSKVESQLEKSKYLHKVIFLINNPASASYQEYGQLLVVVVKAILEWVDNHEKHFRYPNNMKSALQDLITELGGD